MLTLPLPLFEEPVAVEILVHNMTTVCTITSSASSTPQRTRCHIDPSYSMTTVDAITSSASSTPSGALGGVSQGNPSCQCDGGRHLFFLYLFHSFHSTLPFAVSLGNSSTPCTAHRLVMMNTETPVGSLLLLLFFKPLPLHLQQVALR